MSLKVIGAGFGRTGTLSLKLALEEIGFGPCHHMKEVFLNGDQANWFYEKSQGVAVDWYQVFANYSAAVDWPAAAYCEEIAEAFPEAKVVLSVRDPESWYTSVEETIFNVVPNIPVWLRVLFPRTDKIAKLINRVIWEGVFSGNFKDREYSINVFNKNIESVKAMFPQERLLVHSAKDGWEPLCEFLGVPVPHTPYPWVNDTAFQKRQLKFLKLLRWMPILIVMIGLFFII